MTNLLPGLKNFTILVARLITVPPDANPEPACCNPAGLMPLLRDVSFTYLRDHSWSSYKQHSLYLLNSMVKRLVLKVSNVLFPEASCHRLAVVGVSSFANQTTNIRNVTSEYLSFNSSIIVKETPESVILSPMRCPWVASLSMTPWLVLRNVLLTVYSVLCKYCVPSEIWTVPLLVSIVGGFGIGVRKKHSGHPLPRMD